MTDHTRTEKIGGDSIFIFEVFRVERETVITAVTRKNEFNRNNDETLSITQGFMVKIVSYIGF